MTGISVVPVELRLAIDGEFYPLVGADITYSGLGINSCTCSLAVGRGRNTGDAPANGLVFTRNTPAQLYVYGESFTNAGVEEHLPPDGFLLFDGFVDVGGPAQISFGGFTAQVRLLGRLMKLDNGTLQLNNVVPMNYADTTVNMSRATVLSSEDEVLNFGNALTQALIKMATGGVADSNAALMQINALFGGDVNTEAGAALASITHYLELLDDLHAAHKVTLYNIYNDYLLSGTRLSSFYAKIMSFTEALRFRLIELPSGIYMVPYSPLFRAENARTVEPNTYSSVSWAQEGASQYAGCVLLAKGKNVEPIVVGAYKRPNGAGKVMTVPAPAICMAGDDAVASPLLQAARADAKETQFIPAASPLGDRMAQHVCLERIYATRRLTVSVPYFRVDIGPLSSIRIVYPEITDQLGAEVYGSVQQVRISINAPAKSATTTYDVGYVRSYGEQFSDIEAAGLSHPLWKYNLYGTRLDRFTGDA